MMLRATFGVLRQLLLDLGFTMHEAPEDQVRFDHVESNTWFIFHRLKDDDEVNLPNLVAVRRILDEKGLMTRNEFEERLRSRVIAG
jgi:hypothetical protein